MSRRITFLVGLAAALLGLPLAATVAGASPFRAAQAVWREIVSDGRAQTAAPVAKIVVLNAPSVADVDPHGGPVALQTARRAQSVALAALRTAGLHLRIQRRFTVALSAVEATVGPREVALLERAPQVRGVYAVRAIYPAGVTDANLSALGSAARPALARGGVPGDGKGVTVALLDGPVDLKHPYLAGRFRPGWNAVTDQAPGHKPAPPLATRHGTAMAGIVVGSGGPDGLRGVAHAARLRPIQVMNLRRGVLAGDTGTLLAGIERALDPNGDGRLRDHAQVILAPLAAPFAAFAESPEAMAARAAERAGSLLVGAAGNDGPTFARFGTVASPAAGRLWLAVGASDPRSVLPQVSATLVAGSDSRALDAVPLAGVLAPIAGHAIPVVPIAGPTRSDPARTAGASAPGDSADDYLTVDGTRMANGAIALVARDGGPIADKALAAARSGARALVLYGDGDVANGALGLDDRVPIPVLVISRNDGRELAGAANQGLVATLSFTPAADPTNPAAGTIAGFSSRGLGFHDLIKPELVAPGVAITSALPGGGYAAITGTSASAAQVAGDAALVLGAHRTWRPATVRGVLIGTAHAVGRPAGSKGSPLAAVEGQGAGQVDAAAAARSAIVAQPATITFGYAAGDPFTATARLVLRNLTARPATYDLGFQRDGSGDGRSRATLGSDRPRVRLAAHGQATVNLHLTAAQLPQRPGVLGGWMVVVPTSGGSPLRVPWALGLPGAADLPLLQTVALTPSRASRAPATGALSSRSGAAARLVGSQLTITVGAARASRSGRLTIAPVAHLSVDLYRGDQRVSRILDARSLLPGVYRYALTGRDRFGQPFPAGRYRLLIRAVSNDGSKNERQLPFAIRRQAR